MVKSLVEDKVLFSIGSEYKFIYTDLDKDGEKLIYAEVLAVSSTFVYVTFIDKNGRKELGINYSDIHTFQYIKGRVGEFERKTE